MIILRLQDEAIDIVIPGDEISPPETFKEKVFLGPGLRMIDGKIRATRAGILKKEGLNLLYVDSEQRRYIPQRREFVIGTEYVLRL